MQSPKERLLAAIRKRKQAEAEKQKTTAIQKQHAMASVPLASKTEPVASDGEIILNEKQLLAGQYAMEGKEFCLIGAAGTGKTTALKNVIQQTIKKYNLDLSAITRKDISVICFTRRAARAASRALKGIGAERLCMTAHAYLEYQPEKFEYTDEDGMTRQSMRFVPNRSAMNPVTEAKVIIVDEASMLDYYRLYREVKEASPNATFIFVGDLNQIPPVFGHAVLGFKLATLPVIQLTEVYRQAMDSPIVAFQHNYVLAHRVPSDTELRKISETATPERGLEFIPFKKDDSDGEIMAHGVADYIIRQLDQGLYDPEQDIILIPFNVNFGSIAINYHIAQTLGERRNATVWEIIAGREKKYFATGDAVMYEKRDCIITEIETNPKYFGQVPQAPSNRMTRSGLLRKSDGSFDVEIAPAGNNIFDLSTEELLGLDDTESEVKRAASAIITVQDIETGAQFKLSACGEVMNLDFRYAMTIHKSQGSEWRKVWLVCHNQHVKMYNRELLYTGMTRASEKCTVLYSPQTQLGKRNSSIAKAICKGAIPGKDLEQKIEYFKKLAVDNAHKNHEDF